MIGGIAALFVAQTIADAQTLINGAGATFPYPIYSKWISEYKQVDAPVRINYQSIGSGGGQKQITAQTVDFGASDGPMSDENLAQAPGKILHIPTVAGADVIAYNLPGDPKLKLDWDVIVNIFMGNITKWNDPKTTALNPGVDLPDQPIVTKHRADGPLPLQRVQIHEVEHARKGARLHEETVTARRITTGDFEAGEAAD
jgi:phosphate transport system substrate-binding protein